MPKESHKEMRKKHKNYEGKYHGFEQALMDEIQDAKNDDDVFKETAGRKINAIHEEGQDFDAYRGHDEYVQVEVLG